MGITLGTIKVHVDQETRRWEAFGKLNSIRARYAYRWLERLGGVNETVPSGWHTFRVYLTRRGLMCSLFPAND